MKILFAIIMGLAIMIILMVVDKFFESRMGSSNKPDKSDTAALIAASLILAVVIYGFLTRAV